MQYQQLGVFGERQHGLITRAQLLSVVTSRQIDRMTEGGRLIRLIDGVYSFPGTPATWHQKLMVAMLWDQTAVVSHRSALRLWAIDQDEHDDPLEVTVEPTGSARLNGFRVHRTDKPDHHATVDYLRVTRVERSLVDSAHLVPRHQIISYVETALHQRLTSFALLRKELERIGARGRRGVGVIRTVVETYDPHQEATQMTRLERDVLEGIRRLGMPLPQSQFAVRVEGRRYFLDFAYPELKIAIEAHSVAWHTRLQAFEKDAQRDAALTAHGWRVFYVTKQGMDLALLRIRRSLANFVQQSTA